MRPFSSLQSERTNSLQRAVSNLPSASGSSNTSLHCPHAPVSSFMIHPHGAPMPRPRPSASVPTALPNTTIRRILPTVEDTIDAPRPRSPLQIQPPLPQTSVRLERMRSRSPSPVSPPQSALYRYFLFLNFSVIMFSSTARFSFPPSPHPLIHQDSNQGVYLCFLDPYCFLPSFLAQSEGSQVTASTGQRSQNSKSSLSSHTSLTTPDSLSSGKKP